MSTYASLEVPQGIDDAVDRAVRICITKTLGDLAPGWTYLPPDERLLVATRLRKIAGEIKHKDFPKPPTKGGMSMADATTNRSQKEVERELERIERFRKIAGYRANRALDYIEGLLNTSDRSRYSFTDEQAQEIISKLNQAVDQLGAAYAGQRKSRVRVDL